MNNKFNADKTAQMNMMVDETITPDEDQEEESGEGEEETPEGDKTPEDSEKKPKEDESGAKDRRSAIAQKKYWRTKARENEAKAARVEQLETELSELKSLVKKPTDEQEAKAQEYIRTQARQVYEELLKEREKKETKDLEDFEGKVQEILDDNPDISEEELLDTVEDFEVEPSVALRILKRGEASKKEKPKIPKPGRAATEEKKGESPDDSKKSIWQIAQEEIGRIRGS